MFLVYLLYVSFQFHIRFMLHILYTYDCVGHEEIWWTKPATSEVSSAPVPQLCELLSNAVILFTCNSSSGS